MDPFAVVLMHMFIEARTAMWLSFGESLEIAHTLAVRDAAMEFDIDPTSLMLDG